MAKVIKSKNSSAQPLLRNFLGLSLAQFILNLTFAILILSLFNARAIWNAFNSYVLANQVTSFSTALNRDYGWLDKSMQYISQGRIPQMIFFGVLGCIVYIIIWLLRSSITNIRNDFIASQYINLNASRNRSYWRPILLQKIFFAVSLSALIGSVFLSFQLVITLAKLCNSELGNFVPGHSVLIIAGAVVGVALLLHALLVLTRITTHSWSLINNGL